MSRKSSRSNPPFCYTEAESAAILEALHQAGLKREEDWPRYLDLITQGADAARAQQSREPLQ